MKLLLTILCSLMLATGWGGVLMDTGDYIDCTAIAEMDSMGELSVSCWVKFTTTLTAGSGWQALVRKFHSSGGECWGLDVSNNVVRWIGRDSASGVEFNMNSTNTTWTGGVWYHIAATRDDDGTNARLYVNGVEDTNGADGGDTLDDQAVVGIVYIGRQRAAAKNLLGTINDVAVWGKELTPAEVLAIYSSKVKGFPMQVQSASLISYWPLDDYADGTAVDTLTFRDVIGGYTGTATGGASILAKAEEVLSYPMPVTYVTHQAPAAAGFTGQTYAFPFMLLLPNQVKIND